MAEPLAYVEFEGDYYAPWGNNWRDRPSRVHAIVFDDGSTFDMVNGWRHGADPEEMARVQKCLDAGHWRKGSFVQRRDAQMNIPTITMDWIRDALVPPNG